jgi:hypothetical protein
LLAIIADEKDERLPIDARASLIVLAAQLQALPAMRASRFVFAGRKTEIRIADPRD